ncbi:DUF262 domain-containing protein [Janthinobacterium lividum]|uniref:DUF262 domain-containing protein n=1 Tax=Janthinobacterium lividum TaxID=29581 RepID=A0ABU0XXQ7_9BURK|nr:DUF262 domain-containing protein [Janthinobacterium lividum]MDQ4628365.1 DUF262 domain-containing protein [Janthinobacterium lividum]MDQ4676058.1 DUF262 domain-containing protein [Janthinobacterium lividum]MDQ4687323.1 DUF262 domain-containing protein [Janthinobacterium lividum]
MASPQQELVVRGEQVERIYINYVEEKYLVNRRYQRKLIWTIEEKQNFIDSIVNGYPIPIILLADPKDNVGGHLEIIDGMQRMDAITSFINNDFSVNNSYFDLNTFATTKDMLDRNVLEQKTPLMSREDCLSIATYPVPLSIYEFADGESVDEVFRRINSGGRQLSRQELRVAGAINSFSDCVRVVSSRIRGDTSNGTLLFLNAMKNISITNKDLSYGINAEEVFWVKNGILTKDNLRQSKDEELVADVIAYMVSDTPIASRTELFDDYYGASFPLEGASLDRFQAMDLAIRRRNPDLVDLDYQRTHDALILLLTQAKTSFSQLLFPGSAAGNPIPRYFQAVFLAMHDLIVRKGMVINDRIGVINALTNKGKNIVIQEGGRWGAENRGASVKTVVGLIQQFFEVDANPDPAKVHWVTKLQNLLTNSKTEQPAYDFKQGLLELSNKPTFDEGSFDKVMETCAAIANIQKGHKGYLVIGVAENAATALRVKELFEAEPLSFGEFYVTGVEHEAKFLGKNLDQLFQVITDRIGRSEISEPLKSYIGSHMKSVRYFDKTVFVIEIEGQDQPSLYKKKYFSRRGAQVIELGPEDYPTLFSRFR